MEITYLDNSATTLVCKEAAEAAVKYMTEEYGNPSSLHSLGISAAQALESARETVAKELGADKSEVYFTSGGTESNNTAFFGAMEKNKHVGKKAVISAYEHDSMINSAKRLEAQGYTVEYVSPRNDGKIYAEDFAEKTDDKTAFVGCMLVNNEIGAINDVKAIFDAVRAKNGKTVCHCDAVQGFGKIECNVKKLGCDTLSVSGHKIHAPKGIGALYIKKGLVLPARNIGGGQEKKMRSGTEAMPNIMAFAEAVKLCAKKDEYRSNVQMLWNKLYDELSTDGVSINVNKDCLPYVFNFSLKGVRSEVLLNFLSSKGICVSAGSACAKGKRSHVLLALGLDTKTVDGAVRVSFSRYNTEKDVDTLVSAINEAKKLIIKR